MRTTSTTPRLRDELRLALATTLLGLALSLCGRVPGPEATQMLRGIRCALDDTTKEP